MLHAGNMELKILFGEAWLFGLTRQRLTGEVPFAREGNTLCCFGELSSCRCLTLFALQPCVVASLAVCR